MSINIFMNTEELSEAVSSELLDLGLNDERAHVALSGGSTPKAIFNYIANSQYAKKINWPKLHFWWGDERCVSPSDPESNYGEAMRLLFSKIQISIDNLHPIHGELEPEKACAEFKDEMETCVPLVMHDGNKRPEFDLVILGVGEDGHTASLFPGQTDYAEKENALVVTHPESGQLRVSMSAGCLCAAKHMIFLATGRGKSRVIEQILMHSDKSMNYPAARIHSEPGETQWYLDHDAAQGLSQRTVPDKRI